MIFFIIDKTKRSTSDFSSITTSAPTGKTAIPERKIALISWNEVPAYNSLIKLKTEVLKEAKKDPVCLDICKHALDQYGIDPFLEHCGDGNLNQSTMKGIIDKIFMQWAHPMIGNIGESPQIRPELYYFQYLKNWDQCKFIDTTTKLKISELYKTLGLMERSGRDQVRICYNITELARSIIGEITSSTSRRLDKIFALQLCKSATLKNKQIDIIIKLTTKLGTSLKTKFVRSRGFGKSEYLKYYFPDTLKSVMKACNYEPQWYLYENLINLATDNQYTVTSTYVPTSGTRPIITSAINDWKKLPEQMKCVVVMNSFRRFVEGVKCNTRYSMGIQDETTITKKIFNNPYHIVEAAGLKHVPQISFNSSSRSLTWSWNRDEYHISTITYRHYLMNLWGGPSGHGTGNAQFLDNYLKLEFPYDGANTVLTGFFAFWRLYYDKRISVVHTLAETMEGSLSFSGYDPIYNISCTIDKLPDVSGISDACKLLEASAYAGTFSAFVDPIRLMLTIKKKYYNYTDNHQTAYDNLQTQTDALRNELTESGYNVPQWSKELSKKTGMSVRSFSYSESNTRSDLALTMFCEALANDTISSVIAELSQV